MEQYGATFESPVTVAKMGPHAGIYTKEMWRHNRRCMRHRRQRLASAWQSPTPSGMADAGG